MSLCGHLSPACRQQTSLPGLGVRARGCASHCGSSPGASTRLAMASFPTFLMAGGGAIGNVPQGSGPANCVLTGHQEYYTPPAKAGLHPRRARSRRAQLLLCARNRAPTQEPSLHCPAGPVSSQPAVCPGDRRAQMGRTQSSEAWTCSPLTPREGNKGRRHNHRNE